MTAQDVPDLAAAAYGALAPFYDSYTAHPAYAGWILRLELIARAHGLEGSRALDVGCGTGKSLEPLVEHGYDAVGCDPSREMLTAARARLGSGVALHRCGLPHLPRLGDFDYITCLNDVVNYVPAAALSQAMSALAANLARGGVLVFDTSTLHL
jgi:SAM-dependent methyltransferase